MQKKWTVALIGAVVLATLSPLPVLADASVPILILVWPLSWLLLLAIIPIEAILAIKMFQLSRVRGWLLSLAANLVSTIIGIPFAWLLMASVPPLLGALFGNHDAGYVDDGPSMTGWSLVLRTVIGSPWLWALPSNDCGDFDWILPVALITLCIPCYVVSVVSEYLVAQCFIKEPQAYRWSLAGNSITYGMTYIVIIGLLVHAVWSHEARDFGYIDTHGRLVLCPVVSEHHSFSGGLAAVAVHSRFGFIDKTGKMVIQPQFAGVGSFCEGMAAAVDDKGKWGFIDKSAQFVIPPQYDDVLYYSEGMAPVRNGEDCIFIDRSGRKAIDGVYSYAESFSDGLAFVIAHDRMFYINPSGRPEIATGFIQSQPERGSHFWLPDRWHHMRAGYIGKDSVNPHCMRVENRTFSEQLALTPDEHGSWGYIDRTGKQVIAPQYEDASPFSEGLAFAAPKVDYSRLMAGYKPGKGISDLPQRHYQFIDRLGRTVTRPPDQPISSYSCGLATVRILKEHCYPFEIKTLDESFGYIDRSGQPVFGNTFDHAAPFSEGLAAVGQKWLVER
jgi:hypothetical protein